MKLLMIGHLLGDFYFQSTEMATRKKESFEYTIRHCMVYSIVMYVVLVLTTGKLFSNIVPVLLIGLFHLLVDGLKSTFYKIKKFDKWETGVFLIDQLIHIVTIFVISRFFVMEFNLLWIPELSEGVISHISNGLTFFSALLICGKPAAIIVSMMFSLIPETIKAANNSENPQKQTTKEENMKVGAWIGILEREIIVVLGVLGEYLGRAFYESKGRPLYFIDQYNGKKETNIK